MKEKFDFKIDDLEDAENEIRSLKTTLKDKDREVELLQETIHELEQGQYSNNEIDMGIGTLSYNTNGNILIEALMDSLSEKVGCLGVQGFIDLLENKFKITKEE